MVIGIGIKEGDLEASKVEKFGEFKHGAEVALNRKNGRWGPGESPFIMRLPYLVPSCGVCVVHLQSGNPLFSLVMICPFLYVARIPS